MIPNTRGGDKENCSVEEDNANMCNEFLIETKLIWLQIDTIYMKMWSCKVRFEVPWIFSLMNMKMLKRPLNPM